MLTIIDYNKIMNRPKTIFLDIDGTLIDHSENIVEQFTKTPKLLKGTLEKLSEWDSKGYNIILTTGRREGVRDITVKQLAELGIFYDQLIMGLGGGIRVVVNDRKKDKEYDTAIAINLKRNEGIGTINNL
jgi:phosphoglycolate phosphatase-like HAD superfamily hydrolase